MARLKPKDLIRLIEVAQLSHEKRTDHLLQIKQKLEIEKKKRSEALARPGYLIDDNNQPSDFACMAKWSNSITHILPPIEAEIARLEQQFLSARADALESFAKFSNLEKLSQRATVEEQKASAKKDEEVQLSQRSRGPRP